MAFIPITSPKDSKLLFKFDPDTCSVEIVARRFTPETGRYNLKEVIDLTPYLRPLLAHHFKPLLLPMGGTAAIVSAVGASMGGTAALT